MITDVIVPAMRHKRGKSFRKRLGVYSYKLGGIKHKKPGVIPLDRKMKLLKVREFFQTKGSYALPKRR